MLDTRPPQKPVSSACSGAKKFNHHHYSVRRLARTSQRPHCHLPIPSASCNERASFSTIIHFILAKQARCCRSPSDGSVSAWECAALVRTGPTLIYRCLWVRAREKRGCWWCSIDGCNQTRHVQPYEINSRR